MQLQLHESFALQMGQLELCIKQSTKKMMLDLSKGLHQSWQNV